MEIEVLGTGNFSSRDNTSFIINVGRKYLVDCPKNYLDIPDFDNVNDVILTHLHRDHLGDLETLMVLKWKAGQNLNLHTTKEIYDDFKKITSASICPWDLATEYSVDYKPLDDLINFKELKIGEVKNTGDLELELRKNYHPVSTIGFTAKNSGRKLFYSSDTRYDPQYLEEKCKEGVITDHEKGQMLNFGWDADMIFHEADENSSPLSVHTYIKHLEALEPQILQNLYLIHYPESLQTGLKKIKKGMFYKV